MNIDLPSLLIGASPLIAGLVLKLLLDMRLWPPLIKLLSNIPTRSIYRDNPPNLRGEWDVFWKSDSKHFENEKDRHKTAIIYQFSDYCYADYAALDRRYCMTGKIEGTYVTGTYYDRRDKHGYRGAFQLRIVNSKKLEGRWLGFSSSRNEINTDLYAWTKNPD